MCKKIDWLVLMLCVLFLPRLVAVAEEATLSFEDKHKDQQAIYLLYDTAITVNNDWSYTTKTHHKLKLLKEEAKDFGEIPIIYNKGREKISNIKAWTITPDGKKHRYARMQDFTNYEGYAMYSDAKTKMISLPQVGKGAVLDYECTIFSSGLPIKDAFWYTFTFLPATPIKEQNLSITFPKKLGINYKEFNLSYKPRISEKGPNITYSWHLENLDSETPDDASYPPLPAMDNIEESFEFSSIKNWSDIAAWGMSAVKDNLKITPEIEEVTKKITGGRAELKDKARAILEYISEHFRYVSMSFGENALVPHPTDEVFRNKYGDCKDLSLLCMAMLKSAGITSYLALFNEEFTISDPSYDLPIPALFDHVLLLVEDKQNGDFYLDPLLRGYDIGQYPISYQGAHTFIVNQAGGRFMRLPEFDEKQSSFVSKQDITISADSSAVTEVDFTLDWEGSIAMRNSITAMNKAEKEKFYQALEADIAAGGEILEYQINGLEQKYTRLNTHYKTKRKDVYPLTDGMMVVDIGGYGRGEDFAAKERNVPIFYPRNECHEYTAIYRIPEGFNVSYLPENFNLDIGFYNVKREYQKSGNEVKVMETQRMRRKELPKEKYPGIKAFFDQLPAKTQQRILIKKQ